MFSVPIFKKIVRKLEITFFYPHLLSHRIENLAECL